MLSTVLGNKTGSLLFRNAIICTRQICHNPKRQFTTYTQRRLPQSCYLVETVPCTARRSSYTRKHLSLILSYILTIKQLPTGEGGNPIVLGTFEGRKGDKPLPRILLYGFVQVFLFLCSSS